MYLKKKVFTFYYYIFLFTKWLVRFLRTMCCPLHQDVFTRQKKYYTALPPSSVKIPQKYNSKFSHYLQYTHAYLVVASQVIKRKSNGGKRKKHTKNIWKNKSAAKASPCLSNTINTEHNIWGWPPKNFLKFCI